MSQQDRAPTRWAAFEGSRCIASGTPAEVVARAKPIVDRAGPAAVLIFDDATSGLVEIDFRGTLADVLDRVQADQAARVGSAPEVPNGRTAGAPNGPNGPN